MATWTLDKDHTSIEFKAKHLMITTVTGKFGEYEASVENDSDDFTNAKISFQAKIDSINTGNKQRDDHLKSDDFFNAEKYPALTFVSNGLTKKSDSEYTMTGEMTIRDVTKPVSLDVELLGITKDPWGNTKAGFSFSGKINRKDFGLKFHVVNEAGDLLVSDDIRLAGDVQLLKVVEEEATA